MLVSPVAECCWRPHQPGLCQEVAWQLAESSGEDSRVRVQALRLLVALVSRCAGTAAAGQLGAAQLLDRLLQHDLVRPAQPSGVSRRARWCCY